MFTSPRIIVTIVLLATFSGRPTYAFEASLRAIAGPIPADIVRIVDGDTVEVVAYPWPQQSVDVLVRLRGIDAPEIHSDCATEREKGDIAKDTLDRFLAGSRRVTLTDIGGDKYFGRVLANVGRPDGEDAASMLILKGLVRPYDGGHKEKPVC